MINKLRILLPIFVILLLNSCGFRVANQSDSMSFSIGSILTSGDSRVGYRIKNNLLPYSKNSNKKNGDFKNQGLIILQPNEVPKKHFHICTHLFTLHPFVTPLVKI